MGARVLKWGSIAFEPPQDPGPFLEALGRLGEYDWICFSSPRAVDAVVHRVPRAPAGLKVVVVGPSTAAAVQEAGWPVHRIPDEATGADIVKAFRVAGDADGKRIFFPASAIAREEIPNGLSALGAEVHQVTAYRMVMLPVDAGACGDAVDRGEVQVVTFASPSALHGLREGLGEELYGRISREVTAAAMGPTTSEALDRAGWERIVTARAPTLRGLARVAVEAASS
jgi:uroporphyrinogen III methyltransferase/synthase